MIELKDEKGEGDKKSTHPSRQTPYDPSVNMTAPQWTQGQSGNPAGWPKGKPRSLRYQLNKLLAKTAPDKMLAALEAKGIKLDDNNHAEVLANVILREAIKANMVAAKMVFDQTEAPLPKDVNVNNSYPTRIERHVVDVIEVEPKETE